MNSTQDNRFVLFPMGERRFAFPADAVEELARPDHLQSFPHSSPLLSGVLVRRGKIVPVLDIAQLLVGPHAPARKFYLITNRKFDTRAERTAIPVTGECELATLDPRPKQEKQPAYVTGMVMAGEEAVAIVDLDKLLLSTEVEV